MLLDVCILSCAILCLYFCNLGAVFSVYEIALFSKPQTFTGAVARFGRFTLPFGKFVCTYFMIVFLVNLHHQLGYFSEYDLVHQSVCVAVL